MNEEEKQELLFEEWIENQEEKNPKKPKSNKVQKLNKKLKKKEKKLKYKKGIDKILKNQLYTADEIFQKVCEYHNIIKKNQNKKRKVLKTLKYGVKTGHYEVSFK